MDRASEMNFLLARLKELESKDVKHVQGTSATLTANADGVPGEPQDKVAVPATPQSATSSATLSANEVAVTATPQSTPHVDAVDPTVDPSIVAVTATPQSTPVDPVQAHINADTHTNAKAKADITSVENAVSTNDGTHNTDPSMASASSGVPDTFALIHTPIYEKAADKPVAASKKQKTK